MPDFPRKVTLPAKIQRRGNNTSGSESRLWSISLRLGKSTWPTDTENLACRKKRFAILQRFFRFLQEDRVEKNQTRGKIGFFFGNWAGNAMPYSIRLYWIGKWNLLSQYTHFRNRVSQNTPANYIRTTIFFSFSSRKVVFLMENAKK